jgi:kumamolisin
MSTFSLASRFGAYYSQPDQNASDAPAIAPGTPPASGAPSAPQSALNDTIKELTGYIPSEILTLYLGATAAIAAASGNASAGAISPQYQGMALGAFLVCLVLAPSWAYIGVFLTTPGWPPFRAWIWPVVAAFIAFGAYAFAVPGGWLSQASKDYALFGTLAVLFVAPVLQIGGRIYQKLVPPLAGTPGGKPQAVANGPAASAYVLLAKSARQARKGAQVIGAADPGEALTATLRLRRKAGAPPLPAPDATGRIPADQIVSRDQFAQTFGADPNDVLTVTNFATRAGLNVVETSLAGRTVKLSGTVTQFEAAFQVKLNTYRSPNETYRGREGALSVPAQLENIVEGVFGLDDRRMARPLIARLAGPAAASPAQAVPAQAVTAVTPVQVAKAYGFPASDANGQTIGLIEFGGGYLQNDIDTFFSNLGVTAPALTTVGAGASNTPGSDEDSDIEVTLDIDLAGAVAQGARLAVYFAPWTEQGWIDAITTAVHDATNRPSVLSISWGWAESETVEGLLWSQQAIDAVSVTFQEAAALGVTVLVASGDDGSNCQISDGKAHVLYPASDPGVTTCGGTQLDTAGPTDTTWNDSSGATGGGISDIFKAVPQWQASANLPASVNDGHAGRGVPDIAGNADPSSGYVLIFRGGPTSTPIGGTSAVAPLYAGLVAIENTRSGQSAGFLNGALYAAPESDFRDVDDGATNATGNAPGYTATAGWNACTGRGVLINGLP